jgi:terminal uridylyltransferase
MDRDAYTAKHKDDITAPRVMTRGNRENPHLGVAGRGTYKQDNNQHQLGNPLSGQPQNSRYYGSYPANNPQFPALKHDSAEYIAKIAQKEIPNAAIRAEDLNEKESLRIEIQDICKQAVIKHELRTVFQFDGGSVSLQCYGSLSSGYATRSSDMDLAFVSPHSRPDPGSATSEIPRVLEKALLDAGYGARLLTRTRVPIIKFCEKPTPELRAALLEARAQWEKERDTPISSVEPVLKDVKTSDIARLLTGLNLATGGAKEKAVPIMGLSSDKTKSNFMNLKNVGVGAKEVVEKDKEMATQGITARSDEELVRLYGLAIEEGWFNHMERSTIADFVGKYKKFQSLGIVDCPELQAARKTLQDLPDVLSRFREKINNPLDFPKTGVGIQMDINFSNRLAIHNTLLLRCYSHCDARVRLMVVFVKAWAQKRKINNPYLGTLSSYGYVLMVLHYLINVAQPAVVPNLQLEYHRNATLTAEETTCEGYDIRFWRSEDAIIQAARHGLMDPPNTESLGSLLVGFFAYYARPGFNWTQSTLSLRTRGGIVPKRNKNWTAARTQILEPTAAGPGGGHGPGHAPVEIRHRYLLAIEDPFETEHNVGRTVIHDGIVAIRDNFRRADHLIQHLGSSRPGWREDLFADVPEPPSRKTYFGPLPPHMRAVPLPGLAGRGRGRGAGAGAGAGAVVAGRAKVEGRLPEKDVFTRIVENKSVGRGA